MNLPSAVADGWLLALAAIFISVLLPLLRWVGPRWKESRDQVIKRAEKAEAENAILKEEAVKRTEALYEAKIENMLLSTKLEICHGDLEKWEQGRWGKGP